MKKKIHIEYTLPPASSSVLWNTISTPSGLEHWFADKVSRREKTFTFRYNELTNDLSLEVTDFADAGEEDDAISLWDSQIETLRRACGI